MHLGGGFDFPFGRVQMTVAPHGAGAGEAGQRYAGASAGFLLKLGDCTIYHAGDTALTYGEIVSSMQTAGAAPRRRIAGGFFPLARGPFGAVVNAVGSMRTRHRVVQGAALMKVFWPYLTYNTLFDNQRVCEELGERPAPFSEYAAGLYRFATDSNFTYPFRPWPAGVSLTAPRRDVPKRRPA